MVANPHILKKIKNQNLIYLYTRLQPNLKKPEHGFSHIRTSGGVWFEVF